MIKLELYSDLFVSIIFNIVGQMLSNVVADKIYGRLLDLCDGVLCAEKINCLNREDMRNCGMSYSKVNYIKEFALNYSKGEYDFSILNDLDDENVIKYFRTIKGVGKWTAEMLALFSLGRENIFSYDDVALRNGIMKAKGFKTLSKKRFDMLRKSILPIVRMHRYIFIKLMMTRNLIMRKMLISIKPDVYERIRNGTKIFEHRKVFPNESIMAYMYVSSPVKAITGILYLSNRTELLSWKDKYSYDNEAIKRIDEYMKHYNVVMQINDFYETNMITLEQLRKDMEKFVVPQMYYFLDNLPLLNYIENNIEKTNLHKHHDFNNISSDDVCVH